jgi:cysteinyl-tRNA synthetase
MDDDFNSARAIGDIFEFVKSINSIIQKPDFKISASMKDSLFNAFEKIEKMGKILGLDFKSQISSESENIKNRIKIKRQKIEKLIKEREAARDDKDFKKADEIRKYLQLKGVMLEDRKEGTIWKLSENDD